MHTNIGKGQQWRRHIHCKSQQEERKLHTKYSPTTTTHIGISRTKRRRHTSHAVLVAREQAQPRAAHFERAERVRGEVAPEADRDVAGPLAAQRDDARGDGRFRRVRTDGRARGDEHASAHACGAHRESHRRHVDGSARVDAELELAVRRAGRAQERGEEVGGTVRLRFEGSIPEPVTIPLSDLSSYDTGRKWLGILVRVENVKAQSDGYKSSSGRFSVRLEVAGVADNKLPTINNALMDVEGTQVPFTTGTEYASVVGVVQFFYNFSISPRTAEDITPL